MGTDPHAVLGVEPSASHEEIRAAFHRRAMLVHPDLHRERAPAIREEAERAMVQLTEAYDAIVGAEGGAFSSPRAGSAPGSAGPATPASAPLGTRVGAIAGRAGRAAQKARSAARPAYRLGRVWRRRQG